MPSSSSVRITRMAISPRLATRTFSNICGPGGYRPGVRPDIARRRYRGGSHAGRCPSRRGASREPSFHPGRRRRAALQALRWLQLPLRAAERPARPERCGAGARVAAREAGSRTAARGATLPPLFVLAGGPGQSATEAFADAPGALYPAYARRDLIIFDQRGTGRSGLLRCRRLERSNLLRAGPAAAACARSLGRRRAFYTSRDSADDIEAIRAELGAERIALFGISYGTKLALGYAQRYPDRVERLVLDSVVELDGPDPLYLDSIEASHRALRVAVPPALPLDRGSGRGRWPPSSTASRARARCAGASWTRAGRLRRGTADARRGLLDPVRRRLRSGAARRLPRRGSRRAGRRRHAAPPAAPPGLRGRRRAAPAARPELSGLRGHDLRGGDDAVVTRARRPTPASATARRPSARRRSLTRRSPRSTALPRSPATCSTCARAGRMQSLPPTSAPAPLPDVPVLHAGGRGRPAHARGERRADRRAVPALAPGGRAGDRPLRDRRRLQRLRAASVRALHAAAPGAAGVPASPPAVPAAPATAAPPRRGATAPRHVRRPRPDARGGAADAARRGRGRLSPS